MTCKALNLLGFCGAVDRLVSDDTSCLLYALKTKELRLCQVKSLKYGHLSGLGQTQKWGAFSQPTVVVSHGDVGASAWWSRARGRLGIGSGCPRMPAQCRLQVSTAKLEPPLPCGSVAPGMPAPLPGASCGVGAGWQVPGLGTGNSCLD